MEERSKSMLKSTEALLFKGLDDTMTKFDVPEAEYKELLPSRRAPMATLSSSEGKRVGPGYSTQ
jgi:hypothetical protein